MHCIWTSLCEFRYKIGRKSGVKVSHQPFNVFVFGWHDTGKWISISIIYVIVQVSLDQLK